jgi:archaellum component FlaF (FlaF/FlaG flagellin family)
VILVAIAIVIAIAVAFWATGLVGIFTRYEKLEITSIYYDPNTRVVVLTVRNTGSAAATIDDIYVNGRPCHQGAQDTCNIQAGQGNLPQRLDVGQAVQITVNHPPGGNNPNDWEPGVTYEVMVHTASGKQYPAAVLIT